MQHVMPTSKFINNGLAKSNIRRLGLFENQRARARQRILHTQITSQSSCELRNRTFAYTNKILA